MTPWTKTLALALAAGTLAGLVYFSRPKQGEVALIADQGQALVPQLTDPLAIKGLQVISYDSDAAKTRAFSVTFDGKRWVIPSHSGYPADAADKVAAAASAFAGLKKERVVTDNKDAHAALGVLDPGDDANITNTAGLGTRVSFSDSSRTVADIIIGKAVKDDSAASPFQTPPNRRYVREVGKNRVYVTTLDTGFSTKFADWVQTDLLLTTQDSVAALVIDKYNVDPERGMTKDPVSTELLRPAPVAPDPNNPAPAPVVWSLKSTPGGGPPEGQVVNQTRVDDTLRALVGLRIVGVRPKPANLAKVLGGASAAVSLTLPDQLSLQSRGFYLSGNGRLLANEGQLAVRCSDGVNYNLWFGEVVPDTEDAASGTVGTEPKPATDAKPAGGTKPGEAAKPGNSRYMMITVAFDPSLVPEPKKSEALLAAEAAFAKAKADFEAANKPAEGQPAPTPPPAAPQEPPELATMRQQHETAVAEWKSKSDQGKKRAETLSKRFADWYYVIAADSLAKIRPTREELLKPAAPPAPAESPGQGATPPPPPPPGQ